MRNLPIALCVCAAVMVGSSPAAEAGIDEAVSAYLRGDYATALKEFRVLAEQGNRSAQFNLGLMYGDGLTASPRTTCRHTNGSISRVRTAIHWVQKRGIESQSI